MSKLRKYFRYNMNFLASLNYKQTSCLMGHHVLWNIQKVSRNHYWVGLVWAIEESLAFIFWMPQVFPSYFKVSPQIKLPQVSKVALSGLPSLGTAASSSGMERTLLQSSCVLPAVGAGAPAVRLLLNWCCSSSWNPEFSFKSYWPEHLSQTVFFSMF